VIASNKPEIEDEFEYHITDLIGLHAVHLVKHFPPKTLMMYSHSVAFYLVHVGYIPTLWHFIGYMWGLFVKSEGTKALKGQFLSLVHRLPIRSHCPIQGTFREHSGKIQGTFREHSGNLEVIFMEHLRDIQGTFNHSSRKVPALFVGCQLALYMKRLSLGSLVVFCDR
jgi:hypothetical protein